MSADNKHEASGAADAVRRAFAALPFEEKISTLLRVELDMVGDAVETVVNAASRVADDIADAFSGKCEPATDATTTGTASV
jgi:hypothetical protein